MNKTFFSDDVKCKANYCSNNFKPFFPPVPFRNILFIHFNWEKKKTLFLFLKKENETRFEL